jgi:hypothetical protein
MLRLLHAAANQAGQWRDYEAAYARYEADFEAFARQPGVKPHPDGTVTHPDHLTPPAEPSPPDWGDDPEALRYRNAKFLERGRSEREILADLQEKFASRLRVRLK